MWYVLILNGKWIRYGIKIMSFLIMRYFTIWHNLISILRKSCSAIIEKSKPSVVWSRTNKVQVLCLKCCFQTIFTEDFRNGPISSEMSLVQYYVDLYIIKWFLNMGSLLIAVKKLSNIKDGDVKNLRNFNYFTIILDTRICKGIRFNQLSQSFKTINEGVTYLKLQGYFKVQTYAIVSDLSSTGGLLTSSNLIR